ncbi:hypothetical protein DL771_004888 [Monosporascus sp. 5C6A]|nr:hypothetical protein DL771_004888 [Monosporascus sp. 5C6A]
MERIPARHLYLAFQEFCFSLREIFDKGLAELYVHTADPLRRLTKYYAQGIVDLSHLSKQLEGSGPKLRLHSEQQENSRLAQAQHLVSDLIDVWDDEVGDLEHELQLWDTLRFSTELRYHWSHNGILYSLLDWRRLCDNSQNPIFWICSESNGRRSLMTEFSINLVRVCQSQGQFVTFAFWDRPYGVEWTPTQLLKQLVAHILNQEPNIVISGPSVFDLRRFRNATSFDSAFRLLQSIIAMLDSIVLVIDRIDLCTPHPDPAITSSRQPLCTHYLCLSGRIRRV